MACLSKNEILAANFSKLMKALWSPKVGKDLVKHKETAPEEEKETPPKQWQKLPEHQRGAKCGAKFQKWGYYFTTLFTSSTTEIQLVQQMSW